MLTDDDFHAWCLRNAISPETEAYIQRIRSSQPVRKVRNRASNVSGRYPSVKMGRSIQFESHHVELWGIYEMERDDDVLEYYDQPTRIQLQYRAALVAKRPNGILQISSSSGNTPLALKNGSRSLPWIR